MLSGDGSTITSAFRFLPEPRRLAGGKKQRIVLRHNEVDADYV